MGNIIYQPSYDYFPIPFFSADFLLQRIFRGVCAVNCIDPLGANHPEPTQILVCDSIGRSYFRHNNLLQYNCAPVHARR